MVYLILVRYLLNKGKMMGWKEHLRELELNKKWDQAIEFMQMIIEANPDNMDAYIYTNFY